MSSPRQPRRIGLFTNTHDQHAQPLDQKRTEAIKGILLRKHHPNLQIIDFSRRLTDTPDNEALRVSFYHYHQETPIKGVLGVRVLEERTVPALYYAHEGSSTKGILHPRLSGLFSNMDLKFLSLETLVPDLAFYLREHVVSGWARKKAITLGQSKYGSLELQGLLEALDSILFAAENGNPKTLEARRTIAINTIINRLMASSHLSEEIGKDLKKDRKKLEAFLDGSRGLPKEETSQLRHVLSPGYVGHKPKESEVACELKHVMNMMVAAGFISSEDGKRLSQDRQQLKDFVRKESIWDLNEALLKLNQAFIRAFEYYKRSLGIDLNKLIFGEIGLLANNELIKLEERLMLSEAMPAIGQATDDYRKTERLPVFYVPLAPPLPEDDRPPQFLPCADIHLTVSCADRILASKQVQSDFVKAVASWGRRL